MNRKIYSSDEIAEKLQSVPKEVRDFIYGNDMGRIIQTIGAKHILHIDQLAFLETEVIDVLIGTTETENFVPYLVETLEIDEEKANAIAKDCNTLIFQKIRDSMQSGPLTKSEQVQQLSATPQPTFPAADMQLGQKTLTIPPQTIQPHTPPTAPPPPTLIAKEYTTDPYKEPTE